MTETGLITTEQEAIISGYRADVARLGADDPRAVVVVTSREEAHAITERLGQVSTAVAQLEEIRKKATAPLRAQVESVNDLVASVRKPLEAWVARAKAALAAFLDQEERERRQREDEARRAAEEAARKEGEALARAEAAKTENQRAKHMASAAAAAREVNKAMVTAEAATAPVRGFRSKDGASASSREVWDFEIVDVNAIPREYMKVDETMIRRVVTAGLRSIPGVNIFQRRAIAVRR